MSRRLLVIGYGNPGREDDGLGPALARAVERLGLPGVTCSDGYQLSVEDAVDVAAHDAVLFADASLEGEAPCVLSAVAPAAAIAVHSHTLSPGVLMARAHRPFGPAPPAWQLAIRGYGFALREGLTPGGERNLAAALGQARRLLETLGQEVAA